MNTRTNPYALYSSVLVENQEEVWAVAYATTTEKEDVNSLDSTDAAVPTVDVTAPGPYRDICETEHAGEILEMVFPHTTPEYVKEED